MITKLEENFPECEICLRHPASLYRCNACIYRKMYISKINELTDFCNSLGEKKGKLPVIPGAKPRTKEEVEKIIKPLRDFMETMQEESTPNINVKELLEEYAQISLVIFNDVRNPHPKTYNRRYEIEKILTDAINSQK